MIFKAFLIVSQILFIGKYVCQNYDLDKDRFKIFGSAVLLLTVACMVRHYQAEYQARLRQEQHRILRQRMRRHWTEHRRNNSGQDKSD